jgi:cyclopropane-fatty-acyl-phospholipid synthase
MLKQKLTKHLKVGRLVVRGIAASDLVFGAVDPDRPHLDVTISVRYRRIAWKMALYPNLYLGEAYMDGALTIERGRLRDFLELCFLNFRGTVPGGRPRRLAGLGRRTFQALQQRNSRRAARRNVAHHYDLSDELYSRFLDADRQYSCAYFQDPEATLEAAQLAKKEHILAKLLLRPGQRVLDIGCGWGGLALTLARHGASRVTGVTLSQEQLSVARRRAAAVELDHRVGFERLDYRDVTGPFERIVSVGMFEHVGTPHYQAFFDTLARLLTEDGVALLHSIGRMDVPCTANAWIRKYIFPGGYCPALSEVLPAIERAGLWVTDVEILRLHYAETLRHWQMRFEQHRSTVAKHYDDRFCRMWEFYLTACEMGFRYDRLMVFQIQVAKRVDTVPVTRDYMAGPAKTPAVHLVEAHEAGNWERDVEGDVLAGPNRSSPRW